MHRLREIIVDPPRPALQRAEVGGESAYRIVRQIRRNTFSDHQKLLRPRLDVMQQRSPDAIVTEIGADSLEVTTRCFCTDDRLLVFDDFRKIDLDPVEIGRKLEAIRPSIQSGTKIQDGVHTVLDCVSNERIDYDGANREKPPGYRGSARGRDECDALLTRKFCSQRIGEKSVGPRGFVGATLRDEKCRVGNVANFAVNRDCQ